MSIVRRAISTGVLTLAALTATVAFSAAPALAELTLTGTFGSATSSPADPEPLSGPTRLAVNQSNGDVYVIDSGNERVEEFDGAGNYITQFDGSATAAKAFDFGGVSEIAVDSSTSVSDPSAGDVYILDSGHNVVDKFTAAGSFVSEMAFEPKVKGITVDPSGNLWVSEGVEGNKSTWSVRKFDDGEQNVEVSRLPTIYPGTAGLAVDSNGNYYVGEGGIAKFSREGVFEGLVGRVHGGVDGFTSFGIDLATGDVYATADAERIYIRVFDPSAMASELSDGTLLESLYGEESGLQSATGIAVNGLAGKVYVTDFNNNDVEIFSFPVLPGLKASASNVLAGSATLEGTVNPTGRDANTIQFEYGTSTAYGSTVEATPSDAGSGTSAVPVSANLMGLLPSTLYHYRLTATNENGTKSTPDGVFFTPLVKVTVNDRAAFASEVSQFAATLNGTINPGNSVTSYHFEYGTTTAYGTTIPVPEGFTAVNYTDDAVSEQLAGLQAGTTYHFRLDATNSGGVVKGPDETFTTAPIPAPAVSTGGASGVTRGEALVSGTIDPHGWSTSYHFEYGTSTAYGSSWPSVDVSLGEFQGPQPVAVTIENLQPGTTYHYRLRASNGGGTSFGPDMTFTTAEYPTSVIQEPPLSSANLGFFNPEVPAAKIIKKAKGKKKKATKTKSKRKGKRKKR